MALNVLQEGSTYLFEGSALQPIHAAALRGMGGEHMRACFLGYANVSPEEKLRHLRQFNTGTTDWVHAQTDEQLYTLIDEMTRYSRSLQRDCAKLKLRYIDSGGDFERAIDRCMQCLAEDR